MTENEKTVWKPGVAPVAVVMISLNEGHNMEAVLKNLSGWAQEVYLVDSYSKDSTVDIALRYGVHVVQRKFRAFGDQWNFALKELPVKAPWTMKLDPDERISDELKVNIISALKAPSAAGIEFRRRWWLMGRPLHIFDNVLRVWRTGACAFTDVLVNEHPAVTGEVTRVRGNLEHLDSPDLHHWVEKQNRYSTAEAVSSCTNSKLGEEPALFGYAFQRRMWMKKVFWHIPFRYQILFFYFWLWKGLWRSGWVGYASAKLWTYFFFVKECKMYEMKLTGRIPEKRMYGEGEPDSRVKQY